MKKIIREKIFAVFMAVMLTVTTVFAGGVSKAKAADTKEIFESGIVKTTEGEESLAKFRATAVNASILVRILLQEATDVQITLYDADGNQYAEPVTIAEADWAWISDDNGYFRELSLTVPEGVYSLGLITAKSVYLQMKMYQTALDEDAAISETYTILAAGFSQQLTVTGATVSSWKSDDTSIAKVDKNGKVTGVKPGDTKITATTENGTELTCTVRVYANEYSATKLEVSDITSGKAGFGVYNMKYDKSGNLVLKAMLLNNTKYRVTQLKNINITVKDANGKLVGTYKNSKMKVSVKSGATKNFTFVIKKASLKNKKANLFKITPDKITCKLASVGKK